MVLPVIPILAVAAIAGGGGVLLWYDRMSEKAKAAANIKVMTWIKDAYGKSIDALTALEAQSILKEAEKKLIDSDKPT